MNTGKTPENIFKRSILKNVKARRSEVLTGASFGEDCAVLDLKEDEVAVVSEKLLTDKDGFIFEDIFNNVCSNGAEPVGIGITLLLPIGYEENSLKSLIKDIDGACKESNVEILGGDTSYSDAVSRPVVGISVFAKAKKTGYVGSNSAKPGDDIVISKWAGLKGTYILARKYEEKLKEKFPASMILSALQFKKYLTVVYEAAPAVKSGVSAMHDASRGGIFTALWEIAEASHVGLSVDLKRIPIKQETIEICNFFDLNPYNLDSSGAMVMTTDDGEKLVRDLGEEGIEAVCVGKITDSNDKVVINGDSKRFLEPFRSDELTKIYDL